MSDTRERRRPSRGGLQKILDQAHRALREGGFTEEQITGVLTEPIERGYEIVSAERLKCWLTQAQDGDAQAKHLVALQIRLRLREHEPLPSHAADYLLDALESRDLKALGMTGAPGYPQEKAARDRWARAVVVCFLAAGDWERRSDVMGDDQVAILLGLSSAKKLSECLEDEEEPWLWGNGIPSWYRAHMVVVACRVLLGES